MSELELQAARGDFHLLIAGNPNYFGNLTDSPFPAVTQILNNTTYEEITCVAFNPSTNVLEAVIQVKQSTGYKGSLCQAGSFEYVRFFLNYGSGWEDAGLAAVHVHDVADVPDCAQASEKPLSFSASVTIQPKANWCGLPVLPQARAILSWETIPTPGDANYPPVFGNHLDCHIQIRPRQIFFGEVAATINDVVKHHLPAEALQKVLHLPVPLPDPPPLQLLQLSKLYAPHGTSRATFAVPAHRFGFAHLHAAVSGSSPASSGAIATNISNWKTLGLDWQTSVGALAKLNADVTYEQLECLGLEGNSGLERLVGTLRIKRPNGYSGGLCTAGSTEYVAFWADWDDTCAYTYLGTISLQVHDIATIPPDGLCYNVVLPVDLSAHRNSCDKPKIARVRAVLSWAVAPSTVDPNALAAWGNIIDAHVQIEPGTIPNPLTPTFSILGGMPTGQIDAATGFTTSSARFALSNLPADAWGLNRPCPFGGRVTVQGPEFPGYKYRIQVQATGGGTAKYLDTPLWLTRADGTTYLSSPDANNFFTYQNYVDNIENLLGEWDTGGDDKWTVTLEIADLADNPVPSATTYSHVIQLDNTAPVVIPFDIVSGPNCGRFAVGAVISGIFTATDSNFGGYNMYTEPFASSGLSPTSSTNPTGTVAGDNVWTLNTAGMAPCGYVVRIDVSDRSIVNSGPNGHNGASSSVGFCLLEQV